jgi:hypothetical protein
MDVRRCAARLRNFQARLEGLDIAALEDTRRNTPAGKFDNGRTHMQKLMLTFLVGIIALAPAIAAAQATGGSGSGSGSSGSTSSPSGTSGSTGSGTSSGSSTGSSTTGGSGSSTSSPSASPSGSAGDLSQYTTKADCEKAGGMWESASNKCAKR